MIVKKRFRLSTSNREFLMLFIIVVLGFFRFSYLGFAYTPYLDDYIQYSYYPSHPQPWETILTGGAGVLFTRPLAGLMDFFVWSRLYGRLGVAVAIISVLYGTSGVLFYKTLKRLRISVGAIFFAIYIFLPINVEGTYWLSASSRIVVPMFLASVSLWAAASERTALFCIFNFLSMWFYEQMAILSFFAAILIGIELKSFKTVGSTIVSALLLVAFYVWLGAKGDNAQRLSITEADNLIKNVLNTIGDFLTVLVYASYKIATKGFVRGFNIIATNFSIIWLATLIILAMSAFNLMQNLKIEQKIKKRNIIAGAVLTITPLIPFFITQGNSFNLRNAVPCLLGIGIILDNVLSVAFRRYAPLVAAILIFCFSVSAVSEVCDYELTASRDKALAVKISEGVTPDTRKLKISTDTPDYYPQNVPWRDHIKSMTASDWGVTGIVRTISKNRLVEIESD